MLDLEDITNEDIARVIDSYIHNERDRMLMKRRLIDGICYEPLADEFLMSVRNVKNIVYRCEKVIFKHLR